MGQVDKNLDITEVAEPLKGTVLGDELNTGGLSNEADGVPGEIQEQSLEGLQEQLHEEQDAEEEFEEEQNAKEEFEDGVVGTD